MAGGYRRDSSPHAHLDRKTKVSGDTTSDMDLSAGTGNSSEALAQITADSNSSMPNVDNPDLRELEEDTTILGSFCWN